MVVCVVVSFASFAIASASFPLSRSIVSTFPCCVVNSEPIAAETTEVSGCLQDALTIDVVELRREDVAEEEMVREEEEEEGGIAT